MLSTLGFSVGRIDGIWGPLTAAALADFQKEFGHAGASDKLGDLTRAKCMYTFGDATIETRFEAARSEVLAGEGGREGSNGESDGSGSDSAETMSSVLEPERGGFDAVERAARRLRLRLAGDDGTRALDSATVFRKAGERGLIDGDAAERLANAATLWRNLQGIRRLIADGALDVESAKPGVRAAIARSCGCDDFDALTAAVRDTASQEIAASDEDRSQRYKRQTENSDPIRLDAQARNDKRTAMEGRACQRSQAIR